jgi:hypothetical protein
MFVAAPDFVPNASPQCTLFAKPSLPRSLGQRPMDASVCALGALPAKPATYFISGRIPDLEVQNETAPINLP